MVFPSKGLPVILMGYRALAWVETFRGRPRLKLVGARIDGAGRNDIFV